MNYTSEGKRKIVKGDYNAIADTYLNVIAKLNIARHT